jgi:hypothetical protein
MKPIKTNYFTEKIQVIIVLFVTSVFNETKTKQAFCGSGKRDYTVSNNEYYHEYSEKFECIFFGK